MANQRGLCSQATSTGDTTQPAGGVTGAPAPVVAVATSTASGGTGFDPTAYIGHGNRYNCSDFQSQADAQAVLRADPSDANRLDGDRNGIACESNPAPTDLVPVPRS
jgi:hypothetical protein